MPTFREGLSVLSSKASQPKKNEWSLKMGRTGCPEISVNNYRHTLRNIPKKQGHSWACWSETNLQRKRLILEVYFWIISVIACLFNVLLHKFKHFVSAHFLYKRKLTANNPFDHTDNDWGDSKLQFFEDSTLNMANKMFSAMDIWLAELVVWFLITTCYITRNKFIGRR